jgi:hypothetical protein
MIEEAAEIAEENVAVAEALYQAALKQKAALFGVGIISFSIGAAAGVFFTKKILRGRYEAIADQEIAEAKQFYSVLHNKPEPSGLAEKYVVPDDEMGAAVSALRKYNSDNPEIVTVESVQEEEPPVVAVTNIFVEGKVADADEPFDLAYEMTRRTEEAPYVISDEEFFQGEKDYTQNSLTYYQEDDVLVDEREQPINDSDEIVGDHNLLRFGHGSKDKNMVYVRNDRIEIDFEIALSNGSYTKEVLGFIEHSDQSGSRRRERYGRRNRARSWDDDE